jgi:hypothetical protein
MVRQSPRARAIAEILKSLFPIIYDIKPLESVSLRICAQGLLRLRANVGARATEHMVVVPTMVPRRSWEHMVVVPTSS